MFARDVEVIQERFDVVVVVKMSLLVFAVVTPCGLTGR
jgi:hypothetical protein